MSKGFSLSYHITLCLEVHQMDLRKLMSAIITISAILLLASSHLTVAAEEEIQESQQEVFRDYSQEVLRLAREKVEEAAA